MTDSTCEHVCGYKQRHLRVRFGLCQALWTQGLQCEPERKHGNMTKIDE